MIENLVKSRIAIGPLYWLRQIMLAKLDLNLHTDPSIDMAEVSKFKGLNNITVQKKTF